MDRLKEAKRRVADVETYCAAEVDVEYKATLAVHLRRFQLVQRLHVRRLLRDGVELSPLSPAHLAGLGASLNLEGEPLPPGEGSFAGSGLEAAFARMTSGAHANARRLVSRVA